jgi:signal transduction histidine kinase
MKPARLFTFIFLISICRCYSVSAQVSPLDSAHVFALLDTAELYFTDGNYDSAMLYTERAETYSRSRNFKKGIGWACVEKTDVHIDKDELSRAGAIVEQTINIGQALKDSMLTAVAWMQMAQVKMYGNQFDEAISWFTKSLQYYLEKHPSKYAALAFNDLGYTWGRKGELSKQAACLIRSISIYENYFPEKYGELGVAYSNLSAVYYSLNDRPKAIEYAKKSLGFREKTGDLARLSLGCCNISQFYAGINNEEAEKYLRLCVKYAAQSNQESRIIHSYVTAANLYNANKKPQEALEYELKAISLLEKNQKDPAMLARRYMAAGSLYRVVSRDSAIVMSYFRKSHSILLALNDRGNLRDFYQQMASYYNELGEYRLAYDNYRKFITYRDSIVSERTQTSIAEIAARYETEKKDNEITRLNASDRIKQLEIEKQKALIAGNRLEAQKRQNEIELLSKSQALQQAEIDKKNEELEKQMLIARNNEQALELSRREKELQEKQLEGQKQLRNILVAGVVLLLVLALVLFNRYQLKKKLQQQALLHSMRNNIASNLHDDIGASLSNINILNELVLRNIHNPSRSAEYLSKSSEDIQRISESLSDIVWNINPRYDDLPNLFARMKRYAADMLDGKNIQYAIEMPEQPGRVSLNMDQRRDLYLVFKEAINNLVKYSRADRADVRIQIEPGLLRMHVQDNGNGFDTNASHPGNGLVNMRQRAAKLAARLDVSSTPGKGTTILLEMPTT